MSIQTKKKREKPVSIKTPVFMAVNIKNPVNHYYSIVRQLVPIMQEITSAGQKKENALSMIRKFNGIPPRGLMATLAGVHRNTLLQWEKEDEKFKEDLATILEEKRLTMAEALYEGLDRCVAQNQYPAIRDGLKAIDRDTWGESGEAPKPPAPIYLIGVYKQTQILMQNSNGNGKNGEHKKLEEEK
jgi:DNA-binding XRE family transcriptional regulator